jgi:hypothetical protein
MNFRLLWQILAHASPAFFVLLLQNSSTKNWCALSSWTKMYSFVCSTNASVFAVVKFSHLIYQQIGDNLQHVACSSRPRKEYRKIGRYNIFAQHIAKGKRNALPISRHEHVRSYKPA